MTDVKYLKAFKNDQLNNDYWRELAVDSNSLNHLTVWEQIINSE